MKINILAQHAYLSEYMIDLIKELAYLMHHMTAILPKDQDLIE